MVGLHHPLGGGVDLPCIGQGHGAMHHVKISDSYKFGGVLMVY